MADTVEFVYCFSNMSMCRNIRCLALSDVWPISPASKCLLVLLLSVCLYKIYSPFLLTPCFLFSSFSTFPVMPFFPFPLTFLQAFPIYIPFPWVTLLHLMMVRLFSTFCMYVQPFYLRTNRMVFYHYLDVLVGFVTANIVWRCCIMLIIPRKILHWLMRINWLLITAMKC